MNYLQKKKLAFMSIVNQVKGFVRTMIGALPLTLEGCVDENSIIDYKMYGQSVQDGEPTPDNPVEVESVGEKTKNLFDIDNAILNGGTVDNGTIITNNIDYYLKAGTYTISLTGVGVNGVYLRKGQVSSGYFSALSNIDDNRKCTTFTFNEDDYLRISHFTTGSGIKDVMLVEGTFTIEDMPEYEPYGKYKIPVTVSGRNLLNHARKTIFTAFGITMTPNKDGSITLNGTVKTSNASGTAAIALSEDNGFTEVDGAYTLCGCFGGSLNTYYFQTQNGHRDIGNGVKVSAVLDKNRIRLIVCNGVTLNNVTIYPMLIKGDYVGKVPDYEPYHEPITTNIYLDEPLRKVGDYADYIDSENGKVVRKVGNYTFTGNETNAGGIQETSPCFGYSTRIPTLSLSDTKVGLCNYLYQGIYSNVLSNSRFAFLVKTNHPYVYIYFAKTDFPDLADYSANTAKEIIKQWYDNNEPIILFYNLETPTEQPISLPTIPTFKGTSIVSADTTIQPSNAEIEYYSNVKE